MGTAWPLLWSFNLFFNSSKNASARLVLSEKQRFAVNCTFWSTDMTSGFHWSRDSRVTGEDSNLRPSAPLPHPPHPHPAAERRRRSAQHRRYVRPQLSSPSHTQTILDLSRVSTCVEEHRPFFLALPPVEKSHDCSLSSRETRHKTQLRKHGTHRTSRDSAQERKWGGATLSQNSAHHRVLVLFIYPLIWLCKIKMFAHYS